MQIDNVTGGNAILIDYRSGLNAAIDLHASTPTGEPLVHLAHDRIAQPLYYSWSFAKINPWLDRFNQVLQSW